MTEHCDSTLAGRNILVTRSAGQAGSLCLALEARGATAIVLPMIEIAAPEDFAPLDAALRVMGEFRWLFFTSQNAVHALAERSEVLGISLPEATRQLCIAAVGPATAEAASKAGLKVTYTALKHQGSSLATELAGEVPGWRVLLPRSDRANPVLPEMLRKLGAEVVEVVAYRTMSVAIKSASNGALSNLPSGEVDAVVFFSPSAVEAFVQREGGAQILQLAAANKENVAIVAIGEVTAAALQKCGVPRPVQAKDASVEGVVESLETFFSTQARPSPRGVTEN